MSWPETAEKEWTSPSTPKDEERPVPNGKGGGRGLSGDGPEPVSFLGQVDLAAQRIAKAKSGVQRIHLAQPLHVEGAQDAAPPFLLKVRPGELPS